jgi:hypothetical protein
MEKSGFNDFRTSYRYLGSAPDEESEDAETSDTPAHSGDEEKETEDSETEEPVGLFGIDDGEEEEEEEK